MGFLLTILQVIGALVVLGILLFLGFVLWVRWKLKRAVGDFEAALTKAMKSGVGQPKTISLTPLDEVRWTDDTKMQEIERAMVAEGFRPAGVFFVSEIPAMNLQAWAHPEDRAYAVAYEHEQAGMRMDVTAMTADMSRSFTVTSAEQTVGHVLRKGHDKVFDPALPPNGILNRFRLERKSSIAPAEWKETTPATFADDFEAAYANEMAWRAGQGAGNREAVLAQLMQQMESNFPGADQEEMRAIVGESFSEAVDGDPIGDEDMMYACFESWADDNAALLNEKHGAGWDVDELFDDYLVIHEQLTPISAVRQLDYACCFTEDEAGEAEQETLRERMAEIGVIPAAEEFAQMTRDTSPNRDIELHRMGEGNDPIACVVYHLHENRTTG